ncbi:thiol-disulfide oxidoreductase DCC family protein [Demequina sp.]|uniref:thiol-disulfide oxidoreductase DCC family protein n=1 Tax=Demequina sp. TaxID=2050685 RepID=UPI003A8A13B4
MPRPIVIFDGDCGLCNGFVAWLIRHDPREQFLIAGSAGEVGRAALAAMGLDASVAASTLVLATVDGPRLRADAVAGILGTLAWPWRAARSITWVPRRWRNGVYDAIARRRPRADADDPACGMPPASLVEAWRARLATSADVDALRV